MSTTYRIVVGVDGSPGGARALEWAVREAAARGATVDAVTAFAFEGVNGSTLTYERAQREAAERTLALAVSEAQRQTPGAQVASKVIFGYASDVLVDAARSADLLVLGSHGHGRLFHAVLGSVAEQCVRHATCPVVVVPAPKPVPVVQQPAEESGMPAAIL